LRYIDTPLNARCEDEGNTHLMTYSYIFSFRFSNDASNRVYNETFSDHNKHISSDNRV